MIPAALACFLAVMVWAFLLPSPGELDVYKEKRALIRWPLFAAIGLFIFAVWDRQAVIDETCLSLRNAMDFEAAGKRDVSTLDFDKTVELLVAMPNLKEATRICKAARGE